MSDFQSDFWTAFYTPLWVLISCQLTYIKCSLPPSLPPPLPPSPFSSFMVVCQDALELNGRLIFTDQLLYQEELRNKFELMQDTLSPLLQTSQRRVSTAAAAVWQSVSLVCLAVCVSGSLSVCLSVCLCVCLSCLSRYVGVLCVCLFFCMSKFF